MQIVQSVQTVQAYRYFMSIVRRPQAQDETCRVEGGVTACLAFWPMPPTPHNFMSEGFI